MKIGKDLRVQDPQSVLPGVPPSLPVIPSTRVPNLPCCEQLCPGSEVVFVFNN